ncbi:MAG: glycoside hydrolase family 9 protein [Rikenellaceae bacterium]|nr:glycoside hydrolase family 9 protein [Rikenellaceae bacterium]
MKQLSIYLLVSILLSACSPAPETTQTDQIRFNSLGYQPQSQKQATILVPEAEQFRVRRADNDRVVFKGTLGEVRTQQDVEQSARIADFSALDKSGEFYIEIPAVGRSRNFTIADDAYNEAYAATMRAFYLWRCGCEVDYTYNGIRYHQDACHAEDGYEDYIGNKGHQHDGTGGWHDAGDYGKYVVNAGITTNLLFWAWESFQPQLQSVTLGLPETAPAYPEYLKEMKWEIDWLLKMAYPDGSGRVSHKLTATNFAGFIMASEDTQKRYFTQWSSAATADYVAMLAQAARAFTPYDKEYADKCLAAARHSYSMLRTAPEEPFVQGDFKTGGYQTGDKDDRIWAAAEMWETTGEELYLKDFEQMARDMNCEVDSNWDWGDVSNSAMFRYALSERTGKNAEIEATIKKNIIAVADALVEASYNDIYGRPLDRYYWGCNGTVARQALNLYVASQLNDKPEYKNTALNAISHIFGRNYYDRSYVTGVGHNPPMHPHDRRSGADGIEAPWPGYIVGGGHSATDWVDEQESYSHNEVAINWQAGIVFALAWFVN